LPKDNKKLYTELVASMNIVGFSGDEQANMHQVLAGLLHFGNLSFAAVPGDESSAHITSLGGVLDTACAQLGLDQEEMLEGLLWNISIVGGETIKRPYTADHAYDCRDALVKHMYGRVFGWICQHVNQMLAPGLAFSGQSGSAAQRYQEIGILDIFGFENFQKNSLEQLCINVTNEQLQNFFNKHIFENELEE
jgi:myosin-3